MESSIGKLVYCCVSKHSRILYAYNGGDRDLETLASLCVERAPPFHSHYFHTAGGRTFGFLIDGALVSFAIVDHHPYAAASSSNKPKLLHLLHQIKNGYKKSTNNFGDDLVPIIKRLICSLESMNQDNSNAYGSSSSSTKSPLLAGGSSSSNGVERKNSVVKIDLAGAESDGGSSVDANAKSMSLSLSFPNRNRQLGTKLWWRHVKIVVIADVFLCLVLFGIWLAVCRGFRCVS